MNPDTDIMVVAMGVAGLLVLGHGVLMTLLNARLWRHGARAVGHVVDVRREKSFEGVGWFPRVRFEAVDGRIVVFTSNVGVWPFFYGPGDEVAVLYDPDSPYEARIRSWLWVRAAPAVEAAVGLGMTVWAALTFAAG